MSHKASETMASNLTDDKTQVTDLAGLGGQRKSSTFHERPAVQFSRRRSTTACVSASSRLDYVSVTRTLT